MQALEAAGDRAGALRHANVHSELLRTDLDAAPEREVVAFAERLRLESRAASAVTPALPHSISLDSGPDRESEERLLAPPRRCARATDTLATGLCGQDSSESWWWDSA